MGVKCTHWTLQTASRLGMTCCVVVSEPCPNTFSSLMRLPWVSSEPSWLAKFIQEQVGHPGSSVPKATAALLWNCRPWVSLAPAHSLCIRWLCLLRALWLYLHEPPLQERALETVLESFPTCDLRAFEMFAVKLPSAGRPLGDLRKGLRAPNLAIWLRLRLRFETVWTPLTKPQCCDLLHRKLALRF